MDMFVKYISKKQIGVIFCNWKRGNLKLDEKIISWLYNDIAEIRGKYAQGHQQLAECCAEVGEALDLIFRENNFAAAEALIVRAFESYSRTFPGEEKRQAYLNYEYCRDEVTNAEYNGASEEVLEKLRAEMEAAKKIYDEM